MEFQKAFVRLRDWLEERDVLVGGRNHFIKHYRKVYIAKTERIEDIVEKVILTFVLSKMDYGVFVDLDKRIGEISAVRDDKILSINLKKKLRREPLRSMVMKLVEEVVNAYAQEIRLKNKEEVKENHGISMEGNFQIMEGTADENVVEAYKIEVDGQVCEFESSDLSVPESWDMSDVREA